MAKEQSGAATMQPPLPPNTESEATMRGEITIEIVTRTCGDLVCDPMRGLGIEPPTLRSRFSRERLPAGMNAGDTGLDALPAMPGLCVSLNKAERYVRIWDPLGDSRNRERMIGFNQVLARAGKETWQPLPPRKISLNMQSEQMTKNNIATWLYWMQRQLGMWGDKACAVLVPGSASPECELGGDPTINFDASAALGEPRTLSEMHRAIEFVSTRGYMRNVVEPAQK